MGRGGAVESPERGVRPEPLQLDGTLQASAPGDPRAGWCEPGGSLPAGLVDDAVRRANTPRAANLGNGGAPLVTPHPPAGPRPAGGRAGPTPRNSASKQRGLYSEHVGAKVPESLRQTAAQGPASSRFTPRQPVSDSWGTKVASLPAQLYEFDSGRFSLDPTPRKADTAFKASSVVSPRTAAQNQALRDSARSAVVDVPLSRVDEPKLQVPYKTKPGETPRGVLLQREKRLYKSQNLTELLKDVGVDFGRVDVCPKFPSLFDLPLEIFDDTEFECRNPEEWVALGQAEKRGVPCKALWPKDEGNTQVQGSKWLPCQMLEYDGEAETYLVARNDSGAQKWVPRLNLCFDAENPFDFRERVVAAFRLRSESEELMKYHFCVDAMPTEDIAGLEQSQLARIKESATRQNVASKPAVAELLHEVCTDYLRTQAKFMFDVALEVTGNPQALSPEEDDRAPSVTDRLFIKKDMARSMFSGMKVPASQLEVVTPPAPEKGCIQTQTEDFMRDVSDFAFASLLTQPEVAPLIYTVRCACEDVAVMRLFDCSKTRTLKLTEFTQLQSQKTASTVAYLRDKWAPSILNSITDQLGSCGKGWFNLQESRRDVYQHSKLKRLLRLVTAMQQDALRTMVQDSVQEFTEFVQTGCQGSVEIRDQSTVICTGTRRFPMIHLELICNDGVLGYSPRPRSCVKAVLKSFEAAFDLGHIEQTEHRVMAHLLPNSHEVLATVSPSEEHPAEYRQQIVDALGRWLPEVEAYLKKYQEYRSFLASTVESHIDALTTDESTLADVKRALRQHLDMAEKVHAEIPASVALGAFQVNTQPIRQMLTEKHNAVADAIKSLVVKQASEKCEEICEQFNEMKAELRKPARSPEHAQEIRGYFKEVESQIANLQPQIAELPAYYDFLEQFLYEMPEEDEKLRWTTFTFPVKIEEAIGLATESCVVAEGQFQEAMVKQQATFSSEIMHMNNVVAGFAKKLDTTQLELMAAETKKQSKKLAQLDTTAKEFNSHEGIFGLDATDYSSLGKLAKQFEPYGKMWETAHDFVDHREAWMNGVFLELDAEAIEKEVNDSSKLMIKTAKQFSTRNQADCEGICKKYQKEMDDFKPFLPMILALRNPGMRDRHWEQLSEEIGISVKPDKHFRLQDCLDMDLMKHIEAIEKVGDLAGKEYMLETALTGMYKEWEGVELMLRDYRSTGTYVLGGVEELIQLVDDQITMTQAISFSPFKGVFEQEIDDWDTKLNIVSEVIDEWMACQRNWQYLEPIFSSDDIQKQLPLEYTRFSSVDQKWRKNMAAAKKTSGVVEFCASKALLQDFQDAVKVLDLVNKGLNDYLETKRAGFARFYFLSNDELLQILSQTKDPLAVQPHLKKCFEAIAKIKFEDDLGMTAMISGEGEEVQFAGKLYPKGNVEDWLTKVESMMQRSVRLAMEKSIDIYYDCKRPDWVREHPAMCVLNASQYFWTLELEDKINAQGNAGVVVYHKQCVDQISDLIVLIRGSLPKQQRNSIGALVVVEVHARDVVQRLVDANVETVNDFDWISQFRYYWELRESRPNPTDCQEGKDVGPDLWASLVQASTYYGYEYLGNSFRLVITPLTDRCYMTLMGAMHLRLGGAPAGPAGTGKTETVKDLAKALAKMCVVFNCSDGLDFKAMGKFFKGLASAGAWSCFDEFNRINIEVLSVIAQQMITIVGAIKAEAKRFLFEGSDIPLKDSFAVFITMNPGYAGRTELPDNLQALFRPMSMMVPDYALIGEIMFISFGFGVAKPLAQKMVATFTLCSEQLSFQCHYDYGMRAVKTVITAGGNLKRDEPDEDEEMLLLRALVDVNVPKFLAKDLPLYAGIIKDLFPGLDEPEIDYGDLDRAIRESCTELNLQQHPFFIKKVIELYSMTIVRHGMMLVGPTGGGKSNCYKALAMAMTKLHEQERFDKVKTFALNPKAITMGQMYGQTDRATGEWTDGILSTQMRAFVADTSPDKKWIIFDGPVDALWIENMNTVLDDNKKLCLVSGEIIKMSDEMRIMFEVEDLEVASPATVSRCGMIFLEPESLGIRTLVLSWVEFKLPTAAHPHREKLQQLFDDYLEPAIAYVRRHSKETAPTTDVGLTNSCLNIMDCYLANYKDPSEVEEPISETELERLANTIEPLFCFALIWSVGCTTDQAGRDRFDKWIRERMTEKGVSMPFPEEGEVYDYLLDEGRPKAEDEESREPAWVQWLDTQPKYEIPPKARFEDMIVPSKDSICYTYLLQLLSQNRKMVLKVGPSGTGKTVNVLRYLRNDLNPQRQLMLTLGFSAQTSANMTQDILDGKMDKRRKGVFGPPAGKSYFILIDDLNMPKREFYGAQPPIELLRQHVDHQGWFDRKTMMKMRIDDLIWIAAMGTPGGGRAFITNRYMRHFNILAYTELKDASMSLIFTTILDNFLKGFESPEVKVMAPNVIGACIDMYNTITKELLPTPEKAHYTFNLRDLSRVVQGVLGCTPKYISTPAELVVLWVHEARRVFQDRMTNPKDRTWFDDEVVGLLKTHFDSDWQDCFGQASPEETNAGGGLFYGDYIVPNADPKFYERQKDLDKLSAVMNEYLEDYNAQSNAPMPLILFTDAMQHVSRICRIIRQPMGNALLLGVGGSGRQSLTKLATFMAEYELFKIEVAKGYGMNEWRENLKECLKMAGVDGKNTVFLFVDTQIVEEAFLEDLNNILNTGDVPNLMSAAEDQEAIATACRPICASRGMQQTAMNFEAVYVSRVKQHLHMVLAMSPIGEVFRDRLRMFPSLVSCCTIDWFSAWPAQALTSVAATTLDGMEVDDEHRAALVEMVMYVHKSVEDVSVEYYDVLKRKNYVTPTSYLELLSTYEKLLVDKRDEVGSLCQRLTVGLDKLITTGEEVAVMQEELKALQPVLAKTIKEVDEMMVVIKEDTVVAEETKAIVAAEEEVAEAKAAECKQIADDAQRDLDEALPALDAAVKSLEKLSKNDIVEVKSLGKPPAGVRLVVEAVSIMFEKKPERVANPDGKGKIDDYWNVGKTLLQNPQKFLDSLFDYDKDNIPDKVIRKIDPYCANADFTPEKIATVSKACTSVCMWVHAMAKYHHVSRAIEPKRQALATSQAELKVTEEGLAVTKAKLAEVIDKLELLDKNYKEAVAKQEELKLKVEDCSLRLERAHKLLGGLGGEKARWQVSVEKLNKDFVRLQGDVTVAAGSIAYLGPFTSTYREKIMAIWGAKLEELGIPHNDGCNLLSVLQDPVEVREWSLQGLPSDNVSTENAIIVTKARRWPLMIDPQTQGNKWIRTREAESLDIIKLTDKDYLRTLENAIRFGRSILLENIYESLDAALEPVLGKQTFKQRGTEMIKLGDSIVPYHGDFKFYMTTKMANPHYAPEVAVKVSLLNFMITMEGLQEQLLNVVVAKERPDLAQAKGQLVVSMAKMKKEMSDIEDQILHLLASAEGNILDDENLINTLAQSKVTSEEIGVKVAEAEATTKEIEETSAKYTSVAFRGSVLFFCISNLNVVDPMYQYSLEWFTNLFTMALLNAEKDEDIPRRCVNLNEYFTYSVYQNVCRSLFEKDKLTFSFLMTIKILQGYNEIDEAEWDFLCKGATTTETALPNPGAPWLTEAAWIETSNCAQLPKFKGLDQDFADNVDDFKKLFDSESVHEDELPGKWAELNTFQRLLIVRCLRPDKVIAGAQNFITEKFGQKFIEPPPFDLEACFKDATNMTPLIFVLSTGADPMADLTRFAESRKMDKKMSSISLGQGQGPIAEAMIEEGMQRGLWVLLQNCHLSQSWMPTFDKIVEDFKPEKMSKDFRLWLTSMPSPIFPVAILQNGVKMTLEPPTGLRANIRMTYLSIAQERMEESTKPRAWRKLLFAISFFHAIVQERRKYKALGWNISYAFSNGDRDSSISQIHDFLDEYDEPPYRVMLILSGDINYGGRVTDDKDRRTLMSILGQYIRPDIMDDEYRFSPSGTYYAPSDNESRDHYLDYVSTLPIVPKPEVFGMHNNADITSSIEDMIGMFTTILSLSSGGGGGGGGGAKTDDEIVYEQCQMYMDKIPKPLNEGDVFAKYPTEYSECMNTVLMQEVVRYNALLAAIHKTSKEMQLAIDGFVVMSGEMEQCHRDIVNNQVPVLWGGTTGTSPNYNTIKPLAAWVVDLLKRMDFIIKWYDEGAPPAFWISGFFFPQAFLTGVRQNFARKYQLPVDTIKYDFVVRDDVTPDALLDGEMPEDGCHVYGMFIEGARWCDKTHLLADAEPKALYSEMPPFLFLPKQNRVQAEQGIYECPLYKVLTRAGTLSTTGHSTNFVMFVELPSDAPNRTEIEGGVKMVLTDKWIRAGVALFLALRY